MFKYLRDQYILSTVFLISILLMIKSSSIPYFIVPPAFISFVFDGPKIEYGKGFFQFIDMFASSYVTSLIFYIMVDYIPSKQREKKIEADCRAKLVSIYLYLSEFLAMIDYSAEITNVSYDLNYLGFSSELVNCKQIQRRRGAIYNTSFVHPINRLQQI